MGKGRIISGSGGGLYDVTVVYDRDRVDDRLEVLNARIEVTEEKISQGEHVVAEIQSSINAASAALGNLIDQLSSNPDSVDPSVIDDARAAVTQESIALNSAQSVVSQYKARLNALKRERESLDALPDDPTISAWCADYTDDMEPGTEVGTIEVPGEGDSNIIIAPGFDGANEYDAGRHGQLRHREGCTPEQAFVNAALLPGWQKWAHPYRVGTLVGLDDEADNGDVLLDSGQSSAQGLTYQNQELIEGIPIDYMDCNAGAFQLNDRVLVDMSEPSIIGFESEPRDCEDDFLVYRVNRHEDFSTFRYEIYSKTEPVTVLRSNLWTMPNTGTIVGTPISALLVRATIREGSPWTGYRQGVNQFTATRAVNIDSMENGQFSEFIDFPVPFEYIAYSNQRRMWVTTDNNSLTYQVYRDLDPGIELVATFSLLGTGAAYTTQLYAGPDAIVVRADPGHLWVVSYQGGIMYSRTDGFINDIVGGANSSGRYYISRLNDFSRPPGERVYIEIRNRSFDKIGEIAMPGEVLTGDMAARRNVVLTMPSHRVHAFRRSGDYLGTLISVVPSALSHIAIA